MRVVVVGATGNAGTALLRRLAREPAVAEITGVARRVPAGDAGPPYQDAAWHTIDIGEPRAVALTEAFRGAGAVVHLAWQIQPSHDRRQLRRTNVDGTAHVAEATVRAGVPALVVASSVGAYAPGTKDPPVAGPLMATRRAEHELGWRPRVDAVAALADLLDGMARRDGMLVAPLRPRPGAAGRAAAMLSGRLPGHGNPY